MQNTRQITGTPPTNFHGTIALELTASDGAKITTASVNLVVNPINDLPSILAPLSDRLGTEDETFSIQLQASLFEDIDGDELSFDLVSADGTARPDWINFDAC